MVLVNGCGLLCQFWRAKIDDDFLVPRLRVEQVLAR
jgi:hypothetical protein